jgi:hypothetical protein
MLLFLDPGFKIYEHVVNPVGLSKRTKASGPNAFLMLTTFTKTICYIILYEARLDAYLSMFRIKFPPSI